MDNLPKWLVYSIIVSVSLVWLSSIFYNMFDHTYIIPGQVQLAMTAIITAVFGNQIMSRASKKMKDGPKDRGDKEKSE